MAGKDDKDKKGFSGLSDLVSDISGTHERASANLESGTKPPPIPKATPPKPKEALPHEAHRSPTLSPAGGDPSGGGSGGENSGAKWVIGIIVALVVFVVWFANIDDQGATKPPYSPPAPSRSYTYPQSNTLDTELAPEDAPKPTRLALTRTIPDAAAFKEKEVLDVIIRIEQMEGNDPVRAMGMQEQLPPGYVLDTFDGPRQPDVKPLSGTRGLLEFAWFQFPEGFFPAEFTYRIKKAGDVDGNPELSGQVLFRTSGEELRSGVVKTLLSEGSQPPTNAPMGAPQKASDSQLASKEAQGDLDALAWQLFHSKHPELKGRVLGTEDEELHAEWLALRHSVELTDYIFHKRHPELQGRKLSPKETELVNEWKRISKAVSSSNLDAYSIFEEKERDSPITAASADLEFSSKESLVDSEYVSAPRLDDRASTNLGHTWEDANDAYLSGEYQLALSLFEDLVKQGDPAAAENIGLMYYLGNGVEKDYSEARKWYTISAEAGTPTAQYKLGHLFSNGLGVKPDYVEAARWFRLAAKQGVVEATEGIGRLAFMVYNGDGFPQNNSIAFSLFQEAAEQGDAVAQYMLGLMYTLGQGVSEDEVEALACFRKAAEQGSAPAQNMLGIAHRDGRGVAQDDLLAFSYFEKAAIQGFDMAQLNLGSMYYEGRGVSKSDVDAFKWYMKAAEEGNAEAQKYLGVMYAMGKGVAQDQIHAYFWLNESARGGQAESAAAQDALELEMSPGDLDKAKRLVSAVLDNQDRTKATED